MERPLVSIITPSYNSEKYIAETILSVQGQTYLQWELIIVDDGSVDQTEQIVLGFVKNDPRINFVRLLNNSGAGVARNHGLGLATGRFISFLDSDDLWRPLKLERQVNFLLSSHSPFTFCYYDCINEQGKPVGKRITAPRELSYRQLFYCNYVGNLTGIYDADYFGKIPISSQRKRQDWIVWLTILKKVKKAQPVQESLALYRTRENSISSFKWSLLGHNYSIYRSYHKMNVVFSLAAMVGFLFTQLLIKPWYVERLKA